MGLGLQRSISAQRFLSFPKNTSIESVFCLSDAALVLRSKIWLARSMPMLAISQEGTVESRCFHCEYKGSVGSGGATVMLLSRP